MSTTRVYLLRHGQVEGFEQKRYNGQADVPLTRTGYSQFEYLKSFLQSFEISAVYSSDLSRCLEGARMIADSHGLCEQPEADLRERNIGHWQGKTWDELQRLYPEQWKARLNDIVHFRVPGGESPRDVAARVRPAMNRIVTSHPEENIVVVGHGGVNRIILLDAMGAPLSSMFRIEQDYGCVNVIDYDSEGRCLVRLLNGVP